MRADNWDLKLLLCCSPPVVYIHMSDEVMPVYGVGPSRPDPILPHALWPHEQMDSVQPTRRECHGMKESSTIGQKESRVLLSFELYLYKCFDWRQSHPSLRRNPQTGSLGPRENIQKMRRN